VTRVYEEPPVVDPYGNSVAADINRMSGYTDAGGGDRSQTEAWTIVPDAGGAIGVDLSFKVGKFNWSTGGESRPFSAVNPAFSRIYRYDQLAGLAMNAAMGLALNGSVEITVTDPEMAAIFDGSEQVTSIISIPTYIREISLP